MRQLILPIQLRDDAHFDNFYPGENNKAVIEYLQDILKNKDKNKDNLFFLSGKTHAGLTHVLQAICHAYHHSLYLPLKNHLEFSPNILENTAQLDLIVLDDIDAVSGDKFWEEAIFHLFNQIIQHQKQLIISSHILPNQLDIKLADLKSRLQSMLILKIESLSDQEKLKALQLRAKNRGFNLPDDVGQFLLNHASRDMADLFNFLDKLDQISLEEKRKLTIPLVKKIL